MRIVFERSTLLNALLPAMGAVSTRGENKVIQGIRLKTQGSDKCVITSFDVEKGFETVIDADVQTPGCYIISAQKLLNITKNMPDDIIIDVSDKNIAKIMSGNSKFEVVCIEGNKFPGTPELSGDYSFTISQKVLKKLIAQTSFAVADNHQKLQLNGAYFQIRDESVRITALDGFRFAQRFEDCEMENQNVDGSYMNLNFIIARRALPEIQKFLLDTDDKIKVVKGLKHIMFMRDGMCFYTRQIDGDYIEYERFIPKDCPINVEINTHSLRESLERALLVTEDSDAGRVRSSVTLNVYGDKLKISCISVVNRVYDEIPCKHEGEDLEISFNCRFLLDSFRAIEADTVKLGFTTSLSSMLITPVDDSDKSFMYFVFPVRPQQSR